MMGKVNATLWTVPREGEVWEHLMIPKFSCQHLFHHFDPNQIIGTVDGLVRAMDITKGILQFFNLKMLVCVKMNPSLMHLDSNSNIFTIRVTILLDCSLRFGSCSVFKLD